MVRKKKLVFGLLAAPLLLLAACTSSSNGNTNGSAAGGSGGGPCTYTFALITHGDNGNFWSVVYKGAKNAAADLGCAVILAGMDASELAAACDRVLVMHDGRVADELDGELSVERIVDAVYAEDRRVASGR